MNRKSEITKAIQEALPYLEFKVDVYPDGSWDVWFLSNYTNDTFLVVAEIIKEKGFVWSWYENGEEFVTNE